MTPTTNDAQIPAPKWSADSAPMISDAASVAPGT